MNLPNYLVILALYQKQLRRTVKAIIQSLKQMLDLFLFFMFVMLLYAFIGVIIIGDLNGEQEFDEVIRHNFFC